MDFARVRSGSIRAAPLARARPGVIKIGLLCALISTACDGPGSNPDVETEAQFGGVGSLQASAGPLSVELGPGTVPSPQALPSPEPARAVRDSAGVEIVETPGAIARGAAGWVVSPGPLLRIGVLEGAPEYQFSEIRGATRLADGGIALVDRGSAQLRVFDRTGAHVRTVGGRGDGPGQFQLPYLVNRVGSDSLLVFDQQLRRLTAISKRDWGARTVPGMRPASGNPVATSDAGVVLSYQAIPMGSIPGPTRPAREFRVLDLTGGEERPAFRSEGWLNYLTLELGDTPVLLEVPFTVRASAAAGRSEYYFTHGTASEIQVFDLAGTLVRILRIEEAPRPVPQSMLDQAIDSLAAGWAQAARARQIYRSLERVLHIPWFDELLVDQVGWLWARLPHQATSDGWPEWMVFSPDGIAQGTVALPAGLEVQEIGEDYVLGVAVDEFRVPYLRMHTLERR